MSTFFNIIATVGGLYLTVAFLTNHYEPSKAFIAFLLIAFTFTQFIFLLEKYE